LIYCNINQNNQKQEVRKQRMKVFCFLASLYCNSALPEECNTALYAVIKEIITAQPTKTALHKDKTNDK